MARGVAFGRPSKLREDQKDVVRDLVKNRPSPPLPEHSTFIQRPSIDASVKNSPLPFHSYVRPLNVNLLTNLPMGPHIRQGEQPRSDRTDASPRCNRDLTARPDAGFGP